MISFNNVSFKYDDDYILKDFTKTFENGKIYAILGESGIGKTTLLKLSYGLLKPIEGEIINDFKTASYIFDKDNLFDTTVINNLLCISKDIKRIEELLNYFKMTDLKDSYIKKLSNGQRRRVAIIRGLLVDADVYYLDEPIRGIDEDNVKLVLDLFKKTFMNKTVIYITHNFDEIKDLCDEIVRL